MDSEHLDRFVLKDGFDRLGSAALELVILDEVESTNTWAAEQPIPTGNSLLIVLAEHQTGGRGRRGRRWESPPGNLAITVSVGEGYLGSFSPWEFSMMAGLAIREALTQETNLGFELKWPNDVFLFGKKVAGILVETSYRAGVARAAAVGVGVNVGGIPDELKSRAVSLGMAAGASLPDKIRERITIAYVASLIRWLRGDSSRLASAYAGACATIGQIIEATDGNGASFSARALDVVKTGELRVRRADGTELLLREETVSICVDKAR